MRNSFAAVACLAAVVLVSGCEPKIYRAETVLSADGSLSRAIYQPTADTPAGAQEIKTWSTTTHAARISDESWSGQISSLPPATADKKRPYFAAWGQFASAEALPQTFFVKGPAGRGDGTLELDLTTDDYALVKEFRWSETLTDIVTLDDMHRARQELADLLIPLAEKFLNRALGEEYDTSGVVDWLHTSVTPLAFDLSDAFFDHAARRDGDTTQLAKYEKVLSRHGIEVRDKAGNLLGSDDADDVIREFVRKGLKQNLRRRDGQPVPDSIVQELLQWAGIEPLEEGMERPTRFDSAAEAVLQETFGNGEALGQAVKPLAQRILGLYVLNLGSSRTFDYTLEMPGPIVETTGELLTDRKVRWKFEDSDAYPFGYRMTCRALVEDRPLIAKLTGQAGLTREQLSRYVQLVRDNPPLLAVMRICAAEGSLERLRRERDALKDAEDENAASFTAVLEVLDPGKN